MAKLLCKVFNLKESLLIPITSSDLNQVAKRPQKVY